jgi:hypothetical protein
MVLCPVPHSIPISSGCSQSLSISTARRVSHGASGNLR